MEILKQGVPTPPDADHVSYFVGQDGKPRTIDSSSTVTDVSHDGSPVRFNETTDPSPVEGSATIYAKDISGVSELMARTSAGVIQLTSGGSLNAVGGGAFFDGADFVGKIEFETSVTAGGGSYVFLGMPVSPDPGTWVMYYVLIEYVSFEAGVGSGAEMLCGYIIFNDTGGTPDTRYVTSIFSDFANLGPPPGPVVGGIASSSSNLVMIVDGSAMTQNGWISGVVAVAGPFNVPFPLV